MRYRIFFVDGQKWYIVGDCMARGETHLYMTPNPGRAKLFLNYEHALACCERIRALGYDAQIEQWYMADMIGDAPTERRMA